MAEVFLDAFLDTLKVLPFLLVIYIVIELIEHKTSLTGNRKILQGPLAPLIGSAAGIVPLCGFSVMAAKLYDKGYIKTGTLLAVFIATSDEALIILLTDLSARAAWSVVPLVIIKLVIAVAAGYALNALFKGERGAEPAVPEGEAVYSCGHGHTPSPMRIYVVSPLWHSLKIALYLFAVNLVFGLIVFYVGDEAFLNALNVDLCLQPLITAAVGLIPGCASSVIITGAYINGGIAFGSMVAGLAANAGMGFAVLFKNPSKILRNIAIMLISFVIAYLSGLASNFLAPFIGL